MSIFREQLKFIPFHFLFETRIYQTTVLEKIMDTFKVFAGDIENIFKDVIILGLFYTGNFIRNFVLSTIFG